MNAMAAVRSGVGLVTAFAPESVAAQLAAQLPEVMWVPWPETPDGGLALEGWRLLREKLPRDLARTTVQTMVMRMVDSEPCEVARIDLERSMS